MTKCVDSSSSSTDYSYSCLYNIREDFLEYSICIRAVFSRSYDSDERSVSGKFSAYVEKSRGVSNRTQLCRITRIIFRNDFYMVFLENILNFSLVKSEFHLYFFYSSLTEFWKYSLLCIFPEERCWLIVLDEEFFEFFVGIPSLEEVGIR